MNLAKNYKDEQEFLSWVREDRVMELQQLISTWLFKIIISNPKDIEFKQRPWYQYVSVFNKWEFVCYITKEQFKWFTDDESSLNHFMQKDYHEQEDEIPLEPECPTHELELDFND